MRSTKGFLAGGACSKKRCVEYSVRKKSNAPIRIATGKNATACNSIASARSALIATMSTLLPCFKKVATIAIRAASLPESGLPAGKAAGMSVEVLELDLSARCGRRIPCERRLQEAIGGVGLAVALLDEALPDAVDPL